MVLLDILNGAVVSKLSLRVADVASSVLSMCTEGAGLGEEDAAVAESRLSSDEAEVVDVCVGEGLITVVV